MLRRALVVLVLCLPHSCVFAATYFANAKNVLCQSGQVTIARRWEPLLAQGFEAPTLDWQHKNYEENLSIRGTDREPAAGARSLLITYAKERDTAWELISPAVPMKGLAFVRLRLMVRTNRSLASTHGHQDDYASCVEFHNAAGATVGAIPLEWGGLNEQWHEISATGAVPEGTEAAVVRLGWDGPDLAEGEYVGLDDLELFGQGKEPAYESTGYCTFAPVLAGETSTAPDAKRVTVKVAWNADTPPGTLWRRRQRRWVTPRRASGSGSQPRASSRTAAAFRWRHLRPIAAP
jgi:hypothetical protein